MKKFLIVGVKSAITYKDVFPLLKDRKVWLGNTSITTFVNGDEVMKFGNIGWFSNIESAVKKEPLVLTKTYTPEQYPKYDNYDAINVDRVKDIPYDYDGVMGVPITFLDKWDGSDFEVVGLAADNRVDEPWCIMGLPTYVDEEHKEFQGMVLNGKATYARVIIRRKP